MSSYIELVETFEFPLLTGDVYYGKIHGLRDRFPKWKCKCNCGDEYRIVLPYKYPKTADDYVSMKFCVLGRFPVYGIYNRRDLQLIAVCVQGTLFSIDDCHFDPNLVPDLKIIKLNLGIRHSFLPVLGSLSYTKLTMCSAISTLSLGYTPEKKDEWIDAVVLLTGMTTQAVRFPNMQDLIQCGFYLKADAQNILHSSYLSIQNKWSKVSKAIRENKLPYDFKYYDVDDGEIYIGQVSCFSHGYPVRLIDDGGRTKGKKIWRRNDDSNGQMEGSKTKSQYVKKTAQAALEASEKLDVDKTKSLELCGTSESGYPGLSGEVRKTLTTAALWERQPNIDKFKSIESCGMQKVSASIKFLCYDLFGMPKEEKYPKMVKGNQEPREFLQLGVQPISEAYGTTCVYPLQDIMTRMEPQHSNTNASDSLMANVFRRTLRHEGLKGFEKGLFPNLLKVVSSARAPTKLKAAIAVVAKGLLSKK